MKNPAKRRSREKSRGAVSAEMAVLVSLVLIPLLAGIIDFGQVLYAKSVVMRAAREGVMAAIRNEDITSVVTTYMQNAGFDVNKMEVDTSGSRTTGTPVTVTVGYNTSQLFIIPWNKVSPNITEVEASATAQQF